MAKAQTVKEIDPVSVMRDEVTARGTDLLKLIAASEVGYLMLTQAEGADAVTSGFAAIDQDVQLTDEDKAAGLASVKLTALGEAQLASQGVTKAKVQRVQLKVSAVSADVPMPTFEAKKKGRSGSKYPFDTMEVGQSFHVAASLENATPLASLASSLTIAHEKFSVGVVDAEGKPIMETVAVKEYQRNGEGKIMTDADKKRIVISVKNEQRQKTEQTRKFVAAAVGTSDPLGAGARVWRTV
jgi:hypothetical protein